MGYNEHSSGHRNYHHHNNHHNSVDHGSTSYELAVLAKQVQLLSGQLRAVQNTVEQQNASITRLSWGFFIVGTGIGLGVAVWSLSSLM